MFLKKFSWIIPFSYNFFNLNGLIKKISSFKVYFLQNKFTIINRRNITQLMARFCAELSWSMSKSWEKSIIVEFEGLLLFSTKTTSCQIPTPTPPRRPMQSNVEQIFPNQQSPRKSNFFHVIRINRSRGT